MPDWPTRSENAADVAAVRQVHLEAFETATEADLVDALRLDPCWMADLSIVATCEDQPVAHVLLTRCHIGDVPALCLGPCAVLPALQRRGVGSAAITAGLRRARAHGEHHVVVLGHPAYYPRFGFRPARQHAVSVSIDVPPDALMALSLDNGSIPSGRVRYATPFGL